jgi:hypothetical protein
VSVPRARHDRRVGEMAFGAADADREELAVLVANASVLDRRAVDREDPVGGELRHECAVAAWARAARRSSSTESQIESS